MIERADPIVSLGDLQWAAYLAAERLVDYLRTRAEIKARPWDGNWHYFVDSKGAVHAELRRAR